MRKEYRLRRNERQNGVCW